MCMAQDMATQSVVQTPKIKAVVLLLSKINILFEMYSMRYMLSPKQKY